MLCNLGMVHDSLSRWEEAQECFEASLTLASDLGYRRIEGQVLGYLGLLFAHQARFDEAHRCLDSGEAALHAVSDEMSLGILLCSRAEAEHLAGDASAATAALDEAKATAVAVKAGADSELGLVLKRVRDLLQSEQ